MNWVDAALGVGMALSFAGAIVASGMLGWRKGRERGFDEGWREAMIEDDTIDAEWEERAVMLPPPPRKRSLQ